MVALSARKSVHSIADYLDCHKSTVYRVNALANRTGDVVTHGVGPGRPRQLTSLDLDVRPSPVVLSFTLPRY